jgi:hypothetical protein
VYPCVNPLFSPPPAVHTESNLQRGFEIAADHLSAGMQLKNRFACVMDAFNFSETAIDVF